MSENHPIEGLMKTAMESIKEMVDVNTVVGDPVEANDGTVIIPVSKVSCGFGAGGGEFVPSGQQENSNGSSLPFGGGSGGGVSVRPVGFLVVALNEIRFLSVDSNTTVERLIDLAPSLVSQLQNMLNNKNQQQENPIPTV